MKLDAVVLEGNVIRLEPLTRDHFPGLFQAASDPELWRFSTDPMSSEDDLKRYFDEALAARSAGTALPFATVEVASGRVIGSTRFANIDRRNRRLEIGWTFVTPPWQRTAVNTEAKYLMLRHAFETLGCIRVEFKADALNEPSRKAILRIGATQEGIFRNHILVWNGRVRDSVYFSIIDREWPQVKARLEEWLKRD